MQWIKCEDEKPNPNDHMVLVCEIGNHNSMCLGKWIDHFWWIESQLEDLQKMTPTHWARLPKPPEFTDRDRIDRAVALGFSCGPYEGDHHKMWVIDQMLRELLGDKYLNAVKEYNEDEDYAPWDVGVEP